jgi:hypothetical protein
MNTANRRLFLTQAAVLSCASLWKDSVMANTLAMELAAPASASQISGKSLLAKVKWFNEAASANNPAINLW